MAKKIKLRDNDDEETVQLELHKTSVHLPYGGFEEHALPFNFLDANVNHVAFGSTPEELEVLGEIYRTYDSCKTEYPKSLDDVARGIVQAETGFNLDSYDFYTSVTGARYAIGQTLSHLVTSDKPFVAYASPNWIFDSVVASVRSAAGFPFFAFSGDSFVGHFEELPEKDRIAALIVVDPANPLGYRLSQRNVSQMEEVAQEHGIVPIFDDVFRGMQRPGERHSASEFSKKSVVVETTSKRFGIRGIGTTWTLIPKELDIPREGIFRSLCKGCDNVAAMVTEGLYKAGYDSRISDFVASNARAFMAGVADKVGKDYGGGKFVHAFDGMPLMTYHFPSSFKFNRPEDRVNYALALQQLTGTTPGFSWFCTGTSSLEKRRPTPSEAELCASFMRICPTKETPHRSYLAGTLFGDVIRGKLDEHRIITP